MLPSAGGALPLVVTFNTGLVVLAVTQLVLAVALSNLVTRSDTPPLLVVSVIQTVAPFLCISDIPLIGNLPVKITFLPVNFLSSRQFTSFSLILIHHPT